jgi:glycosyltransferase involved in cell wall biosynthesis
LATFSPPQRELQLLIVPAHAMSHLWPETPPVDRPDRRRVYRLLDGMGIHSRLIDLNPRPWNPWERAHSVLRAIDPLRALRILLRHRDADVVVAFYESAALLVLVLRRLLRFRGKVVVIDLGVTRSWRLRQRILDIVVPRADALLVYGTNQVAFVREQWPGRAPVEFMYQDEDLNFYRPVADQPDGPVVAVGDDPARDFATLLAASRGLDMKVIIKSGMVQEDRASYPNVQVVSARISYAEYRQLLAEACIVVVPLSAALHASGVTTVLEAMGMGKPCVISGSEGILDYAIDAETCLVVPCGDADAMRAAITRLRGDPDLRARLGRAARAFVEQNCSAQASAAHLADVFRRVARR